MRRPVLTVELNGVGSLVSGYGAAEMVETVTGRRPTWIPLLRGWSVQQDTARSVIALAEHRNYDIEIVGARAARKADLWATLSAAPAQPEQPDPGRGRW